ncbi:MAG: hypothetical protein A3E75_02130 [Planctomycetes bacterium RIFCSPHIGHO2_12_FULL_51_37]|nr:MAG: hypothetical protein A3E75_02130 [Planctomycetes bacterium RIFCSPHIGHO2_12_FULL_51_37]
MYGGRSETSPVLAPLVEDSVIKANGRVNAWFRVPLTGGLTGWVRVQDISEINDKTSAAEAEEITPVSFLPFRPPIVTLREGVLTSKKGSIDLKFHVEDDQDVRVVYVMVNDVKVFYEYNKDPTDECDFTAELPIAEGLNLVRVIAYDNQGLSTEKPFVITGI